MLKRVLALCLVLPLIFANVQANEENLPCKSALLMDFESGKILYELNPHEKMPPASVTKIMTMLLTMEAIERGEIKYDDIVTGSAYAKSMGGSTIFLDEGEQLTVDEILKGIAVASGNDACVAIAEHICGSTQEFVAKMNQRAKELGMVNTNFVNCNGLDAESHYTTAYDIALMSRELMKHEDIFKYTGIWMDSLRNGEFTLSNTNKLIRFYDGATGLKTGSTSNAGFCISATAKRDNLHLIAVIMNSPTSKERQFAASSLLNYGFGKYSVQKVVKRGQSLPDIKVEKGTKEYAKVICSEDLSVLCEKNTQAEPEIIYEIPKHIKAPAKKGEVVGKAVCKLGKEIQGSCDIILNEHVKKINFTFAYGRIVDTWLGNNSLHK